MDNNLCPKFDTESLDGYREKSFTEGRTTVDGRRTPTSRKMLIHSISVKSKATPLYKVHNLAQSLSRKTF